MTIDGVRLPALPDVDLPYVFVIQHTAFYYLQYSREPYYADYWKSNASGDNPKPYYEPPDSLNYADFNDGRIFRLPLEDTETSVWPEYTAIALLGYDNDNCRAVWSNYDIYYNYPEDEAEIAFKSTV